MRGFGGTVPCRSGIVRRRVVIGPNRSPRARTFTLTVTPTGLRKEAYQLTVRQAGKIVPPIVAAASSTSEAPPPGTAAPSTTTPPQGGPFTFDDEFNGPVGAGPNYGLNGTYWYNDPCWTDGCGNESPTYFSMSNAYLDGQGDLVLEADRGASGSCGSVPCTYTSARLTMLDWAAGGTSSWSQTYGTFSARIKLPTGQGLWPAFWLQGTKCASESFPPCGEIDVMEAVGQQPGIVQQYAHGGSDFAFGTGWSLPAGESVADWHTYSLTWSPTQIQWQVDGQTTQTLTASEAGSAWDMSFEAPFAIVLDLSVGGTSSGLPNEATVFPAKMLVNWIRVTAS